MLPEPQQPEFHQVPAHVGAYADLTGILASGVTDSGHSVTLFGLFNPLK